MSDRVAFFSPSLDGGGAERVMVNLANGFSAKNLEVDFILARAKGPYLGQLSPRIRVVDLNAKRVLFSLPGLIRYLRTKRPKAMLVSQHHANIVAILAKQLSRFPGKLVVREEVTVGINAAHETKLREKLFPFLMRLLYPYATSVIAVSRGVAEDLIRLTGLPEGKVKIIFNPAVTPDIFAKSLEVLDHPWFRPGEPPVILGVGRLEKQKDFQTLIRAFSKIRQNQLARLMILGEGRERQSLESVIKELNLGDDVSLPGFVENPYKYMKSVAAFVLSSRWEGLPMVLIEAMALGAPIVSTDCPSGPIEILENGKWGRLVPVGNVDALATAIALTLNESSHPDVVTRSKDFDLDPIVKDHLALLDFT